MKTSDLSLYPMPSENGVFKEEIKNLFFLIGYIMARGLYDDRLFDMPLNSVFWDIVFSPGFFSHIFFFFVKYYRGIFRDGIAQKTIRK